MSVFLTGSNDIAEAFLDRIWLNYNFEVLSLESVGVLFKPLLALGLAGRLVTGVLFLLVPDLPRKLLRSDLFEVSSANFMLSPLALAFL